MRKITEESIRAFYNGHTFNKQNMGVSTGYGSHPFIKDTGVISVKGKISVLSLHGHHIAVLLNNERLFITNAGWSTNTTKERLNGLDGVSIQQKDFHWFLNGHPWNGLPVEVAKWTALNEIFNNDPLNILAI